MFGYNIQFCNIQNPHSSPEFSLTEDINSKSHRNMQVLTTDKKSD